MIAEDEKPMAHALELKLGKAGFESTVANDGEEAIQALKKENYDLILLDLMMPKMDGLTMLKKLRAVDKENKIPVILLSNLTEVKDISEALALGAHDYFVKSSWKLEDVVAKVNEKIQGK